MCELLGMSANVPTDIVFSFTGLMQRGGGTGPHRDGWGIGFYEGRGLRLFQDPSASVDSEVARLVQRYPIKSETVIGHIRQANVGKVCLANTHPFVRELWGRNWCFAHNGQLADFQPVPSFYRPVVSAWKSTVRSASFNRAGPKGARRVMWASLVEQKQNSQSPSLTRALNTPRVRYSEQACTSTGSSTSTGTGSGKPWRTRLSRSQKAASLSVSPTGR